MREIGMSTSEECGVCAGILRVAHHSLHPLSFRGLLITVIVMDGIFPAGSMWTGLSSIFVVSAFVAGVAGEVLFSCLGCTIRDGSV